VVHELDVSVWELQSRWPWLFHCQPPLSTLVPWQPLPFQEPFSEPELLQFEVFEPACAVLTAAHSVVLLTAAWWIAGATTVALRHIRSSNDSIRSRVPL
jgi:hypothetical protein